MGDDEHAVDSRRFVSKTRLEAVSDGVFAIAITLLVLDLAISDSGSALERVLEGWPYYLAYVVSFITIGAAWLVHTAITEHLARADLTFLRLNLLLLMLVAVLPFPTRLVAEGIDDASGERVFVATYGLVLLGIRVMLWALATYARRERLVSPDEVEEAIAANRTVVPVVIAYGAAILIGMALPALAVGLYCLVAIYLIVPVGQLARLFRRS